MEISFTEGAVRISVTAVQPITQAPEVGGPYNQLDLICSMYSLTGTSPTATIDVYTAMQNTDDDAWAKLGTFPVISTSNKHERLTVTGVLRYVRYFITLAGTTPVATFTIRGYARNAT